MAPCFSIIVPAYNVEPYLTPCIESVLAQSFGDFEAIVVDDGSTDGTPAVCDKLAQRDDRVVVIHKPNGGLSSARNAGTARARGTYIVYLDGDDWIRDKRLLERCLNAFSGRDVDVLFFDAVKFDEEENVFYRSTLRMEEVFLHFEKRDMDSVSTQLMSSDSFPVAAWKKAYARELLLDDAGELRCPFDENLSYSEDIEWTFRALSRARRVGYVSGSPIVYRLRADSSSLTSTKTLSLKRFSDQIRSIAMMYDRRFDQGWRSETVRAIEGYASYQFYVSLFVTLRLSEGDVEQGRNLLRQHVEWAAKGIGTKAKLSYVVFSVFGYRATPHILGALRQLTILARKLMPVRCARFDGEQSEARGNQ
ncbi:glycosyltransferase family 2 protein [Thermophilibacter sp.]